MTVPLTQLLDAVQNAPGKTGPKRRKGLRVGRNDGGWAIMAEGMEVIEKGFITEESAKARMDFRYTVHGRTVVEDVKTSGTDTNQSKRKRRAVLVQHGVEVVLV